MNSRWIAIVSAAAITIAASASPAPAEVLLAQMNMVRRGYYGYANANAIGADDLFGGGKQLALQIAVDFRTTRTGHILTQVEVANLLFEESTVITDARISVYPNIDGRPAEEPVYSDRFSAMTEKSPVAPSSIRNLEFDDGLIGLRGVWTIVFGLHIVLVPETEYFLCVQVATGPDDWAYTVRDDAIYGQDSYCRDGPPDEDQCRCGYGFTDWRTFDQWFGQPKGDAAYRVVATRESPPEPAPDRGTRSESPERKPPGDFGRHQRSTLDETESDVDP